MLLSAVLLFVALATSDVSGRASPQYDLLDCRVNRVADKTHHANDPGDCRVFYNCDNAHGGKRTTCPEGTIYDVEKGLCDSGGDCDVWSNQANCLGNPTGIMRFKAQCCHTYFEYECATRSFKFQYCSPNQYFNPNPSAPYGGSCGPATNPVNCDLCNTAYPDTCDSAGLEAAGPCQFKYRGIGHLFTCAPGTALNMTSCRCILDIDHVCGTGPTIPVVGCDSKRTYSFRENKMVSPNAAGGNPTDFQLNFLSGITTVRPMYFLGGADLSYTTFAFKLRLSLDNSLTSGSFDVLTGTPACAGLKMEIRVMNQRSVTVTFTQNGEAVSIEGTVTNLGFNEITMVVVFDLGSHQLTGNVDGTPMRETNANSAVLGNWATRGLSDLCEPVFNYFRGSISEFTFWRGCSDMSRLN